MSTESQGKPSEGRLCPKCREPIAHGAKTCKHCGADLRNWFARHKVITAILAIVVLGWFLSKATPTKPAAQQAAETPRVAQPAATPQPIRVTATQLSADYQSNEVAADAKYEGKPLEVTGKVKSIDSGVFGSATVILEGSDLFNDVHCTIADTQRDKAAKLSKGAQLIVRGKGGSEVIGSPVIDECVLP